jgi:hypothetical protein
VPCHHKWRKQFHVGDPREMERCGFEGWCWSGQGKFSDLRCWLHSEDPEAVETRRKSRDKQMRTALLNKRKREREEMLRRWDECATEQEWYDKKKLDPYNAQMVQMVRQLEQRDELRSVYPVGVKSVLDMPLREVLAMLLALEAIEGFGDA